MNICECKEQIESTSFWLKNHLGCRYYIYIDSINNYYVEDIFNSIHFRGNKSNNELCNEYLVYYSYDNSIFYGNYSSFTKIYTFEEEQSNKISDVDQIINVMQKLKDNLLFI